MKAFGIVKYGSNKVILQDVAEPQIGPDDVLVEIKATSINPLDLMLMNGDFKQLLKYKLPLVLGHDMSGVVISVGANVGRFRVGDEVFSRPRDFRIGTFTERIAVDQSDLAIKPNSISFGEAAALPLVGLAAYQSLHDVAQIKPGQKVLIHGGAGGLGSIAIQIAKYLGAYVATTVRTKNLDFAKQLGADEIIDFSKQDFTQILKDFDVVIDALGPESVMKSLQVLKKGGIVIGFTGPPDSSFAGKLEQPLLKPVMSLMSFKVRRQAKKLGVKYSFFFMTSSGKLLELLAQLVDNNKLKVFIDKTFDFSATGDALDYVRQGKAKGKVVITRT